MFDRVLNTPMFSPGRLHLGIFIETLENIIHKIDKFLIYSGDAVKSQYVCTTYT